jgi:hypothetical protein
VFSGTGVQVLDIANLDRANRQLELALSDAETKTPPARVPTAL